MCWCTPAGLLTLGATENSAAVALPQSVLKVRFCCSKGTAEIAVASTADCPCSCCQPLSGPALSTVCTGLHAFEDADSTR
jgi:hypothetical protein